MWDLLIETQTGKPPPRQVHAQFLYQFPFAGDAVQIADQQNAQQKLGINGRSASIAVTRFQLLPHKRKADVLFNEPQQMSLGNMIFQAKVVEQRFGAVVLPHHDQQASNDENPTEHARMLPSNTLLPNLILLIDVTFSTPTGDFTQNPAPFGRTVCRACHSRQMPSAIWEYRSMEPASSVPNQRQNSSYTTRCTSSEDSHVRNLGRIVPVSVWYSSGLTSKLIPTGSYWNNSAVIELNNSPYSALSWRRSSRICSRVLGMGFTVAQNERWLT